MKHTLFLITSIAALLSGLPRAAQGQTPTTFRLEDSAATSVQVAGEFNDWKAAAMERGADGAWTISLDLPDGTHGYKFLVNGETWILDPANPARKTVAGNENSAVTVGAGAAAAPAPSASGETTFSYTDPQAQAVFVAGSFNGWNTESHPMSKNDAGVWTATVSLPPGQTTYKFIVDGQWKTDPSNPTLVPDGEGGSNSAISNETSPASAGQTASEPAAEQVSPAP